VVVADDAVGQPTPFQQLDGRSHRLVSLAAWRRGHKASRSGGPVAGVGRTNIGVVVAEQRWEPRT
jgi:hypothetical protein